MLIGSNMHILVNANTTLPGACETRWSSQQRYAYCTLSSLFWVLLSVQAIFGFRWTYRNRHGIKVCDNEGKTFEDYWLQQR